MSNIQANLNQLLTMAAVGAKLAPGSEKRAEIYQTKKQIKDLTAQERLIAESGTKMVGEAFSEPDSEKKFDEGSERLLEATNYRGEITALHKKLFELQPSTANYEAYRKNLGWERAFEPMDLDEDEEEETPKAPSIKERLREKADAERELAEETRREEIRKSLLSWRD